MSEAYKSVEKQVTILPQDKSVWQPNDSSMEMMTQVETVRSLAKAPPLKIGRRALFSWLRIFVHNPGDGERVNLRIPIPIPLVGLLLPSQPPVNQALRLRNMMAIEFIRVEEDDGELVIIGLD